MFCEKCGNALNDADVFCNKCGNPVGGVAPQPTMQQTPYNKNLVKCKNCGAEILKFDKKCPFCGVKIKKPIYKKWWFWVLLVIFALFILIGGGDEDVGGQDSNPGTTSDSSDTSYEETEKIPAGEVSIEETVLLDEAGIKITAKSLDVDGFWGADVKLLIENNSGTDLTVQCRNSSVNGYMVETMMSVDVADGKKANDELTFSSSGLEASNITTITDMEFSFHVFTSDDWDTYLDTPQIRLETSAVNVYEQEYDDSGEILYDSEGIKIVAKGLADEDSIFGPGLIVYIENNSGENFTVQTRDLSINGFMVDGIFSSEVMIGKRAVDGITFFSSDLEDNGITEIENMELYFTVFETDDWDTIVDTDIISLEF